MQSAFGIGPELSCRVEVASGDSHRLGDLQPFVELACGDRHASDRRVGGDLRPRLAVGRLSGRFEGAFVGVDGPRQREPVVALLHGFVRLLHGRGCRSERLSGVQLCAGGARRIDGALRTIDFFLGSFGAAGENEERADRDSDAAHRPAV